MLSKSFLVVWSLDRFDAQELGEPVNVGSGHDLTIEETAEMVRHVVGFGGQVPFDAGQPDGTPMKLLDISKISPFGWKPVISLRQGLESTYHWYCHGPFTRNQSGSFS